MEPQERENRAQAFCACRNSEDLHNWLDRINNQQEALFHFLGFFKSKRIRPGAEKKTETDPGKKSECKHQQVRQISPSSSSEFAFFILFLFFSFIWDFCLFVLFFLPFILHFNFSSFISLVFQITQYCWYFTFYSLYSDYIYFYHTIVISNPT